MSLKIAIVGANGTIGAVLLSDLKRNNYDVTAFYSRGSKNKNILNLLKPSVSDETGGEDRLISGFDVVVFCAGITKSNDNASVSLRKNIDMINNLLLRLVPDQHLIFLSSIDVELLKTYQYTSNSSFNLAYAKSKVECERILIQSKLKKISILRLAPVYSNYILSDLAKRVMIPGFQRLKIRLVPSPKYKLCHMNIVISSIKTILDKSCSDRCKVYHLNDEKLIKQKELLDYFEGTNIIFPLIILHCLKSVLSLLLTFEKAKKAHIILRKIVGEK